MILLYCVQHIYIHIHLSRISGLATYYELPLVLRCTADSFNMLNRPYIILFSPPDVIFSWTIYIRIIRLFYVLVPENAHTAISFVYVYLYIYTSMKPYVFASTWEKKKDDGIKKSKKKIGNIKKVNHFSRKLLLSVLFTYR